MLTGSPVKLRKVGTSSQVDFQREGTVCRVKRIQISGITVEYSDCERYIVGFA